MRVRATITHEKCYRVENHGDIFATKHQDQCENTVSQRPRPLIFERLSTHPPRARLCRRRFGVSAARLGPETKTLVCV